MRKKSVENDEDFAHFPHDIKNILPEDQFHIPNKEKYSI